MEVYATFATSQEDQILHDLLQQKAGNMTPALTIDEYITQMIRSWIEGQVRGKFESKTRTMNIRELWKLFGGL